MNILRLSSSQKGMVLRFQIFGLLSLAPMGYQALKKKEHYQPHHDQHYQLIKR